MRQVSHDQDKVSNSISKLNFNPVYDDCKHTVIRVRTTSFDETPVKGMQKCSVLPTMVIVPKKVNQDLCTSSFNANLNKLSNETKQIVHKKNGSVAFEISRESPKIVDDHIPKKK